MLNDENPSGSTWAFAAFALARMGPAATDSLIPLLDSQKEKVRREAARILVGRTDMRVKEAFLKALYSEDVGVRAYSADGLGLFNEEEVKSALLARLSDDKENWGVRRAAAAALGKMYETRFREPLARLARENGHLLARDTASNVLVYQNRDLVGQRLGRRYAPFGVSPVEERGERLRYSVVFSGTLGLLAISSALTVSLSRKRLGWIVVLLLALVCVRAGWAWGYELEKMSGRIELLLNAVMVPAAVCCSVVVTC